MLRQNEKQLILNAVNKSPNEADCKRITHISGLFGSGKSWLVSQAESEISDNHLADAVFRFVISQDMGYLPEFLNNAFLTFKAVLDNDGAFTGQETEFNMKRYLHILNFIKEKDNLLFEELLRNYVLKSDSDILIVESLREQTPDYRKIIDSEINNIIEFKGDKRLLLETSSVVAESFIVDLMNYFFMAGSNSQISRPTSPKKIVIIIDGYDLVAGSINNWLAETFFSYCYHKKFKEFVSYNLNFDEQELSVSDFFDFRFILAERDNIFKKDEITFWDDFRDDVNTIILEPFNKEEISDYIKDKFPDINPESLNPAAIAYGIPFIINSWVDFFNSENDAKQTSEVYRKVFDEIVKYKNDIQKSWIQYASFLNEFDTYGLRCFPMMNKTYKDAFSFFEQSTDIAVIKKQDSSKLELHNVIKEYTRETFSLLYFNRAKEYKNYARIYNDAETSMTGLSPTEFEVVRNLAYFKRFNEDVAIDAAFQVDAGKARDFLKKYPVWFQRNGYSLELLKEKSEPIMKLNKLIDKDSFDDKQQMMDYIWQNYSKGLTTEMNEAENEIPELFQQVSVYDKESVALKQTFDENQRKFIDKENELIDLRKKLKYFTNKRNLTTSITNFSVAVVVLAIAYIFPKIFPSPEAHDSISVIQFILYITSSVFALIGLINLIKSLIILFKKKDVRLINEQIRVSAEEKKDLNEMMNNLKEQRETAQRKSGELNDRIKQLHSKIQENRQRLEETFI